MANTNRGQGNKGKFGSLHHNWKPDGVRRNLEAVKWYKNRKRWRFVSGNHTFGDWERLKAQYDFTCPCCKKKEPSIKLLEDHIISASLGGSDNIENIQPLCRSCNAKKYTKTTRYEVNNAG